VRIVPVAALAAAAVLVGCGATDDPKPAAQAPARAAAAKPDKQPLIEFRRVRYEGATMRILRLYDDGAVDIDIPNGGAGWSDYTGLLRPRALERIRGAIEDTPWRHLTRRKVTYDRSGAYYMMKRDGHDYVAMADRMSKDLVPVVQTLNGVLNGGYSRKDVGHRYFTP
jgi:hypothetical protein